jgi:hypothetical protein
MLSSRFTTGRTPVTTALIGVLAAVFIACGGDDADGKRDEVQPGQPAASEARAPKPPFARDGIWNRRLPDDSPVDPNSKALVKTLRTQVAKEAAASSGPYVNTWQYSTPVYRVRRNQPRVKVTLDNPATYAESLRQAISSVPIPKRARPARGSDGHMVVYQRSTDTMWEFWRMEKRSDGWHAKMAGRMENVSRNPGVFGGESGFPWGATATSLPLLGGLMRPAELRSGLIEHALALAIPAPRASTWAAPALRTDGSASGAEAIPLGARFRLDPEVDVDKLKVSRPVKAMARAAQRYGIVVRDTAGAVVFYGEDPSTMRRNPYPRIFGKQPLPQQLSRFPWNKLELMQMDLKTYRGSGK